MKSHLTNKLISYAQNGEDVMLFRAFKDLADGFYVDIGAHDPVVGSVTKLFYERGWRGINVEPGPRFEALVLDRPRDLNLNCAVGLSGTIKLYEIRSGLSTEDPDIAQEHVAQGYDVVERVVASVPLNEIFVRAGDRDVHFLKIDTEGAERQILLSGDFTKYRPWIMVVEATYPMTQRSSHQQWEYILDAHDYRMVWFDGLNRWYLASEHFDRFSTAFHAPLNFFDNYINYREQCLLQALEEIHRISGSMPS
ncbi:MAG: FkbM family methyltransferase [Chromatiaceae bacterium]|nr:FkbM family methyltransferase [Chromatiaceae bacterium]